MATEALTAIEAVLWTYFDGLYESDVGKLGRAFHDASHLYALAADGSLTDWPRAVWFDKVAARPSPKSRGLTRTDRIVSIDLSGPETAFVKVECSIAPAHFTDYLTLLKFPTGWRIVTKTFRTEIRP